MVIEVGTLLHLAAGVREGRRLGADDRVLAALAGHRDPRSIEKYAKLEPATIASALKRLREAKRFPAAK